MRVPFLILSASLALISCKNNDMHDSNASVDENVTAENIVSNDVTAIDAVTGDSANMAADVDVNYGNNVAASSPQQPSPPARAKVPHTKSANPAAPGNAAEPTNEAATNSQ